MDNNNAEHTGEQDIQIVFKTNQGQELHGKAHRVTRFLAVFEAYNIVGALRVSEALQDFQIVIRGRPAFKGRAVLRSLIDTGPAVICEATLQDGWQDIGNDSNGAWRTGLREDFSRFISSSEKNLVIQNEFKIAVADLQMLLMDLRTWLEQVELAMRSYSPADRALHENEAIQELKDSTASMALRVLERFEISANKVDPQARPAHISYMKRQIHPLVLCAPFIHRTFYKPLGYAGDYEMVNMMVRDPFEGASLYAKIANNIFLSTPPVVAHRDRLTYLTDLIRNETLRAMRGNRPARVFNLGCGPAAEIQRFLVKDEVSNHTDFTLLDFNDETLAYTSGVLNELKRRHSRSTPVQLTKRSVHQMLKDSAKIQNSASKYEMVYCAGLFDYLSDSVCKRLMNLFYELLLPGGLLVVTNVAASNPSVNWMEYVLDWHLIYRSESQLATLKPEKAPADSLVVRSVGRGENIFLEIRKPGHG